MQGPAALDLFEGDDRLMLVKMIDDAGVTSPLWVRSSEENFDADGSPSGLFFDNVRIVHISWVGLRKLPSGHTNPVFVIVDDQPIRSGKGSSEWCLKSVEQCWSQKVKLIELKEMQQAKPSIGRARLPGASGHSFGFR